MRQFNKTFAAVVLTLALSLSAIAGEMPCGIAAPPPEQSQTTSQTTEQSADSSSEVPNPVVDTALDLLQSLLALL